MKNLQFFPFLFKPVPDFIIIGAQKGGTSSLFSYLKQHPEIDLPDQKEIHFFDHKYDKGIQWYRNCFPVRSFRRKITGEATPYYLFHPLAAKRIKEHFPSVKLIVLLREPADRGYSQYMMEKKVGNESLPTFEEALDAESERLAGETEKIETGQVRFSFNHQMFSYASRGLYYRQLLEWRKYFPTNQFLFIKSENFFDDPHQELTRVYNFLGVKSVFPGNLAPENTNNYHPMLPETRIRLQEYFKEDSWELAKLLGDEFSWKT